MKNIVLIVLAATLLTSCKNSTTSVAPDGPSDADVISAVQGHHDSFNAFSTTSGTGHRIATHSVNSLGCREYKNKDRYLCGVEIDATFPFAGRSTKLAVIEFVQSEGRWQGIF